MALNVGRSTKMALAQHGKGVNWLAAQLGVSKTRASNIANRETGTKQTIDRLSELFGMSAAEFVALGEKDPAPLNEKK